VTRRGLADRTAGVRPQSPPALAGREDPRIQGFASGLFTDPNGAAVNGSVVDVWIMLVMGMLGYVLRKFEFDVAFTSVLKRAIRTEWIALSEMDQMWIPEHKTWRLNERHYGAFRRTINLPEGIDKGDIAADLGEGLLEIRVRGAAAREEPERIEIG
jgi:hypothetical protein